MSVQFLTLDRWATEVYGEAAPTRRTLIRWAKQGLIQPPPQKHGRSYFVVPSARYGAANDHPEPDAPPPSAKVKHESATSLIERLINERKALEKSRRMD